MSLQIVCFANRVFIVETELCSQGLSCQHLFGSGAGHVHGSQSCSWFVVDRR